ncbi:MAG TPA: hypothetical protein ENJ33_02615 [Thiothrix sp.]|nr:hypothetical protein [Thiothrix sp.]
MFHLITELAIVLVIAAFIGWLTGRYVCKSGEHEERKKNKQLFTHNQLLEKDAEQYAKDLQALRETIKASEKQRAILTQQKSAQATEILTLEAQQKEMLLERQQLEQCLSKQESLSEDLALLRQQQRQFKERDLQQSEEIETLLKTCRTQEKERQHQQQRAQDIQQENQKLNLRVTLLNNEKNELEKRLQQSYKDNQTLHDKSNVLHEDTISFNQKMDELRQKIEQLKQRNEAMSIENNDYLGRLRAISSVVDVVGTAPSTE